MGAEQSHAQAMQAFANEIQCALDARVIDKSAGESLRAHADAQDARGLAASLLAAVRGADLTDQSAGRGLPTIVSLVNTAVIVCAFAATPDVRIDMAIGEVRCQTSTLQAIWVRYGRRDPRSYAALVRRLGRLVRVLPSATAVQAGNVPCPTCGHVATPLALDSDDDDDDDCDCDECAAKADSEHAGNAAGDDL